MFQLANFYFEEVPELEDLATFCLTETIKEHLKIYFDDDYNTCSSEELFTKVKIEKLKKIFPEEILNEMESIGVNSKLFISKKLAQFMNMLNDTDTNVPDIFIEYMLYNMIKCNRNKNKSNDGMANTVVEHIPKLQNLIREYAKDYLDFTGEMKLAKYVINAICALTVFNDLLGPDEYDFTFWDFDFSCFDSWGFEITLYLAAYGDFGRSGGYDIDYVSDIFTKVGEPVPRYLK